MNASLNLLGERLSIDCRVRETQYFGPCVFVEGQAWTKADGSFAGGLHVAIDIDQAEQLYQVLGVVLAEYAAGKTSANLQLVGR